MKQIVEKTIEKEIKNKTMPNVNFLSIYLFSFRVLVMSLDPSL